MSILLNPYQVQPSAGGGAGSLAAVIGGALTSSATAFAPGLGEGTAFTTEAPCQFPVGVDGTVKNLAVYADSPNGTTRQITLRKNGVSQALVAEPDDLTEGWFEDAVGEVSVSAGDLVDLMFSRASGTYSYRWRRALFQATVGHAALQGWAQFGSISFGGSGGSSTYAALNGGGDQTNATESTQQQKVRAPGTASYFFIYVTSNTRNGQSQFRLRINGTDTGLAVTVPAGSTGRFVDSTHTIHYDDGDLISVRMIANGTSGACTVGACGLTMQSDGDSNDLFNVISVGTRNASATTHFWPLFKPVASADITNTNEAETKFRHGFSGRISNLRAYVTANTCSGTVTLRLRKNGANGNSVVSILTGTTGWVEDSTHTDDFTADDDVNLSISGGTAGSITIRFVGVTETDT